VRCNSARQLKDDPGIRPFFEPEKSRNHDGNCSRDLKDAYDRQDVHRVSQEYPIYVPAICLVELVYLVEKNRLPAIARERLLAALDDPERPPRLVPMDRAVVDAVELVSRNELPDMPDRIVAATALALHLPVVSHDARLQKLGQVRTSDFARRGVFHFNSTGRQQLLIRIARTSGHPEYRMGIFGRVNKWKSLSSVTPDHYP
jgi:predicted nucleic acid-binding protein